MINVEVKFSKILNCNEASFDGVLTYITYGAESQHSTVRLCDDCICDLEDKIRILTS